MHRVCGIGGAASRSYESLDGLAVRSWWLEMVELTARTCDEYVIRSLIYTLSFPWSICSIKTVNNIFQH